MSYNGFGVCEVAERSNVPKSKGDNRSVYAMLSAVLDSKIYNQPHFHLICVPAST